MSAKATAIQEEQFRKMELDMQVRVWLRLSLTGCDRWVLMDTSRVMEYWCVAFA